MGNGNFVKSGVLTIFLIVVFIAGWELYLRSKNVSIAFDDGKELWADKRARVYQPANKATVFIGSSRIKYDLDIPTWRRLTNEDAVQLAAEGTTPLPVLDDLAADENFAGKLVIDVTEGLFFSNSPFNAIEANKSISYYKKRTPAEKVSFALNHGLEQGFVFLDKDNFSLNAFFDKLQIKNRPGVFVMPLFPLEFGRISFDRQNLMTDKFLTDTNLQKMVTGNWELFRSLSKEPPVSGAKLDSFFVAIKDKVDKIKSRGGQVIFVRTPSSGPMWMGEQAGFPREKYWDKLLSFTNTPGIHFKDYPPIANFICPEWSHLSPADAITFTRHFYTALQQKGWQFASNNSDVSLNYQP